jgi:hypothetical protein
MSGRDFDCLVAEEALVKGDKERAQRIARAFFAAVDCRPGRRVWLARPCPSGRHGLGLLQTTTLPDIPHVPGRVLQHVLEYVETAHPLAPREVDSLADLLPALPAGVKVSGYAMLAFARLPGSPVCELVSCIGSPGGHDEPPGKAAHARGLARQAADVASLILRPEHLTAGP